MYNIAVIIGEIQLSTQRKVLGGIVESAHKDGNNVIVYSVNPTEDSLINEGECYAIMHDDFSFYDGYIIYAESIYSSESRKVIVDKIKSTNKPAASIDCFMEGMINISSDNESAMRMLVRHMIDVHHIKSANFISGPVDSLDSQTRTRVFREEMERSNIVVPEERIYHGSYFARSGREAIEYYEEKGLLDVDCIMCANDGMALGAYFALNERDIRVPEDIKLSGYDDISDASNLNPQLSTITRFEEKIGQSAYCNLINMIKGEQFESHPVIVSEPIYAESCGCSSCREGGFKSIVNGYVEKIINESRNNQLVGRMSDDFTKVESYTDIADVLKRYAKQFGGDLFWLSLFETDPVCGKIIVSELCYQDGKFSEPEIFTQETKKRMLNEEGKGDVYIINTIHYRENVFGFTLIRNSQIPSYGDFYSFVLNRIGNAIEQVNNSVRMKKMIRKLDEMWVFDPMTHVYNRAGFYKFADELRDEARNGKEDMFIVFVDVDGLKKVNDRFGHESGDRMICAMADVLRKGRNKGDLLMRYGGDEFVILGKGLSEEEVCDYIKAIRRYMDEVNDKKTEDFYLNASIGYCMVGYANETPIKELIELADKDMYEEKRLKHSAG